MEDFEKEFLRKVRIRKFAVANMGGEKTEEDQRLAGTDEQTRQTFSQYAENLREADESKVQYIHFSIVSHRKRIGRFIVFAKKAVRKLKEIFMGWYWFPIFNRQSFFNGKAVNILTTAKDILLSQEQRIVKHEQKLEEYGQRIERQEQAEREREQKFSDFVPEGKKPMAIELLEKVNEQERRIAQLEQQVGYLMHCLNVTCDLKLLEHREIDYFDFENHFRGPRDKIKESQRKYVDYFRINGGGEILDVGCGRGEFLELMYDYGIPARGIDMYPPFVEYCRGRGFRVEQTDALTYLDGLEDNSLGGIFMSQVVEHLSNDYIQSLIQMAYKKLKTGCCFILETQNPQSLCTYQNFYIDPGHAKPIHFLTLEYLFKSEHFESVERLTNEFAKYPAKLEHVQGGNIENLDSVNQGVDSLNELLFGYLDYTLVARK